VVFASYITVAIPILALLFGLMVRHLPKLVVTTWDALLYQEGLLSDGWRAGSVSIVFMTALQMFFLVVQFIGIAFILVSVARLLTKLLRELTASIRRGTSGLLSPGVVRATAVLRDWHRSAGPVRNEP
jgi:hypothetical protein